MLTNDEQPLVSHIMQALADMAHEICIPLAKVLTFPKSFSPIEPSPAASITCIQGITQANLACKTFSFPTQWHHLALILSQRTSANNHFSWIHIFLTLYLSNEVQAARLLP
jgi:hypothetical protein